MTSPRATAGTGSFFPIIGRDKEAWGDGHREMLDPGWAFLQLPRHLAAPSSYCYLAYCARETGDNYQVHHLPNVGFLYLETTEK